MVSGMRIVKKAIGTGVLAVLALGAGTAARRLGLQRDPRIEQLLQGPGAVERLASQSERDGGGDVKEPKAPLLVQAEAFASYLNPSAPPNRTPAPSRVQVPRSEVAPIVVSPKFRLIGISYHRSNPDESRALVCEPGGTQRWVKQGAELGRLRVAKINRGSILYEDGAGTQEMRMESELAPLMPVQSLPERPPPQDNAGQTSALAQNDVPDSEDVKEAHAAEADMLPVRTEESAVARVDPPPVQPQAASPVPGRRARPVRSVARKE